MDRPELAPFIRMVRKTRIALGVLALICLPFGVLLLFLNDPTMSATANLALKVGLGGFFLSSLEHPPRTSMAPANRESTATVAFERVFIIGVVYRSPNAPSR